MNEQTASIEESPVQVSYWRALEMSSVRRLWLASAVSVLGDKIMQFAVYSFVVFGLHVNAFQVSFVVVVQLLPSVLVSPLAGVYVDRWNAKRTMICCDLLSAGLVCALLYAASLNAIYVVCFVLSILATVFSPASSVAVRKAVPESALLATNGLMVSSAFISQIIAPAIGAMALQWFGRNPCFLFDSLTFLFSAALLRGLVFPRSTASDRLLSPSILRSMKEGLAFALQKGTVVFVVASLAVASFAINCFGALLSIYVRDVLKAGVSMFAGLDCLVGIGMVVGTQLVPVLAQRLGTKKLVIWGLLGTTAGVLLTSTLKNMGSTAIAMLVVGFSVALVTIPSETILQQEVPVNLLGRVGSVTSAIASLSTIIGMVIAAPIAQIAGVTLVWYANAAILSVTAILGHYWVRRLPNM